VVNYGRRDSVDLAPMRVRDTGMRLLPSCSPILFSRRSCPLRNHLMTVSRRGSRLRSLISAGGDGETAAGAASGRERADIGAAGRPRSPSTRARARHGLRVRMKNSASEMPSRTGAPRRPRDNAVPPGQVHNVRRRCYGDSVLPGDARCVRPGRVVAPFIPVE
jgi:hypothetical protein